MKHTFLHISDLHYRSDWPEENGLVCEKFAEDIKNQTLSHENAYAVFSGDLVFSGGNPALYAAFRSGFGKSLEDGGFPHDRRICIPGNHDVSQEALKPLLLIQRGTLSEIKDEQTFNDSLPQINQLIFTSKFENYRVCETQFAKFTCCASALGGTGWELPGGVGIFCLNTALCSSGGLKDPSGRAVSDQNQLMVDTRSLNKWLSETEFKARVLVMHHPLEWLAGWAKSELEKVISSNFQLTLCGHIHENSATFSCRGAGGCVTCVAPPLFTKKADLLGYSVISLDADNGAVEVAYRQWSQNRTFVTGTSLAGNDLGKIVFSKQSASSIHVEVLPRDDVHRDTLGILEAEFAESCTCYSSKRTLWVDRDLASVPETHKDRSNRVLLTPTDIAKAPRRYLIRAPKQFGLTCLGKFLALDHYRQTSGEKTMLMMDTAEMPRHREGMDALIAARCLELKVKKEQIGGLILDNWFSEKSTRRILRELSLACPNTPTILLESLDDCARIDDAIEDGEEQTFEPLFLWSLSRGRIRELVAQYIEGHDSLDENLVTKKIVEDIDALNIHRTPLNCLLILKLTEQAFDDSPVNRTEMIGRVLYLLFYQFDKIPRYATRPDLKDCEYALGFFCEWLVRSGKTAFSKTDFYKKVQEYCSLQILDLEVDVLFAFLASEHIFVRKGADFEFRFTYWLYFFAAHRMHHDPQFAEFILSEQRYSAFPEIVEFYAGIDRRRSDAVARLTQDLQQMNSEFLKRTGIPAEFNPFKVALWSPSDEDLDLLKKEVTDSMAQSAVQAAVKDAAADRNYDRSKPYHQALAQFIHESSLRQMVQAMKGAARALRNSDHVAPEAKSKLLEEVILCWVRVCQIMVILSPALSGERRVAFEGMFFWLDETFDQYTEPRRRWETLITVIPENVVNWYQEDIFSRKMGTLLTKYLRANEGSLGELLVLLLQIQQKPIGWAREVENFIVKVSKNSFYLNRAFVTLQHEFKLGFSTERNRADLRRLTGMAIAKHSGAKHPNRALIENAAKQVLDNEKRTESKEDSQPNVT